MNLHIERLPKNHPRRRAEELREAQQTDPAWVATEVERRAQVALDAFAQTRRYDGILSACTYVTSTVPKFAGEAQTCINLRDATWSACYQIMADVQAGQRTLPTVEQALAELPTLEWAA